MKTRATIVRSADIFTTKGTPALYRAAAQYLETHGWQRGTLISEEDGPACAVGGIYQACVQLGITNIAADPFVDFLQLKSAEEVYAWNDAPERTAEEIIKTFYAFADYLEEQEK